MSECWVWWFPLEYIIHRMMSVHGGCMETGRGYRCMDGPGNLTKWCINTSCICSWRCNGLELSSRRISCSHAFWCFPRPILAIFHIANVFLSGFPLFFSTEVCIIFHVQVERQEAVEEAVEFQDRSLSLLLCCFYYVELFNSSLYTAYRIHNLHIKYNTACI